MNKIKLKLGAAALLAAFAATTAHGVIAANQYKWQQVISSAQIASYPEWSQPRFDRAKNNALAWNTLTNDSTTRTFSRSMAFFWKKEDRIRYGFFRPNWIQGANDPDNYDHNDGVQYLAHRGMVQMKMGINENTLDAVQNAAANGINMVELDIQASSDGRPILAHDDTLSRVTTISDARVDSVSAGTIANWAHPTVFTNPDMTQANTTPRYCQNGNQLMSLDRLFYTLQGRSGYPANTVPSASGGIGTCATMDRLTYFLDPKNLNSGRAAFEFVADSARSGTEKGRFYVKTYDNFWSPSNHSGAAALAVGDIPYYQRDRIIVMPVISVRARLDAGDVDGAVSYALSIVKSWSDQGIEVGAVEFPGAWDDTWNLFVNKFRISIRNNASTHITSNPILEYWKNATTKDLVRIPPIVSYGYRFPDYSKDVGGVYKFFNFNMSGVPSEDTVNRSRGRLGAAYMTAGGSCKAGVGIANDYYHGEMRVAGCFVTTDFPLWEMDANGAGDANPKTTLYSGSPERNMNN